METSRPLRHVHTFGDESSHTGNHEFMVYGTVSCEAHRLDAITKELEFPDFRHEFHWSEAERHLEEHKEFASAIFRCIKNAQMLRFRCIVVKASHMRHREYNQNDPDLGLEKYIHRQLMRYALDFKDGDGRFYVTLDPGREHKFPPSDKCRMLNLGYRKETGFSIDPFVWVKVEHSHLNRFVQAADVLAGAVAWVRNKRYRNPSNSGKRKEKLVKHIAGKAHLPIKHWHARERRLERGDYLNFHYPTFEAFDTHGFSIWNFDLTFEERAEQKRISHAQLGAIPDPTTTFEQLERSGYHILLACAHCNNKAPNDGSDSKFQNQRITRVYRPKCSVCWKPRVVVLHPDPRDVPLLARLNQKG